MPRPQIEKSFSDLAIASLGDSLPGLMEYFLGFEIVSTGDQAEQSGTRAAGLLGFDIGGEQILMPVLFLNGQIKGNNCLYLKNSDTFVSASPEWVEYLTSRSSGNSGEPSPSDTVSGIPTQALRIFNQPPQISNSKYAELDQIFEEFVNPEKALNPTRDSFNVPEVLKSMGKNACFEFMAHVLEDHPDIFAKMANYYPGDDLKIQFEQEGKPKLSSLFTASLNSKVASAGFTKRPIEDNDLKFVTIRDIQKNPSIYTEEQKRAAFTEEVVVVDNREQYKKTKTFSTDYVERFSAPVESGFYSMVNTFGELKDVFIVHNGFAIDNPRKSIAGPVIIDPDNEVYYLPIEREEVLVCPKKSLSNEDFRKAIKDLPSIDTVVAKNTYVAISPLGQVSIPFEVLSKHKSPNHQSIQVETMDAFACRIKNFYGNREGRYDSFQRNLLAGTTVRIIDSPVEKVTELGNTICVSSDWKVIKIKKDYYDLPCCASEEKQDEYERRENKRQALQLSLKPGSLSVLIQAINDNAIKSLAMEKKGSDYLIVLGEGRYSECSRLMKKTAAMVKLMSGFGLSHEDAIAMMDSVQKTAQAKVWVKIAAGYTGMAFPDYSPDMGINDLGARETTTAGGQTTIPMETSDIPDPNDPALANFDKLKKTDMEFLNRAADTNQKSVFDPAMIGVILKSSRSMAMVDHWLPDLVKALDSACRLSLLFYWKNTDFAEAFGADSLSEFEDLTLNNIKQLGQLVLHLKQRMKEGSSGSSEAI